MKNIILGWVDFNSMEIICVEITAVTHTPEETLNRLEELEIPDIAFIEEHEDGEA